MSRIPSKCLVTLFWNLQHSQSGSVHFEAQVRFLPTIRYFSRLTRTFESTSTVASGSTSQTSLFSSSRSLCTRGYELAAISSLTAAWQSYDESRLIPAQFVEAAFSDFAVGVFEVVHSRFGVDVSHLGDGLPN